MNHSKRIVFDFDDTISFTKNRDWENAEPNLKLINRINSLFESGWQIDIFTARGSISCASRAEADKKYRKGIEEWLAKHKVKYHNLSFDKPLANYYVDDKSLTPDEFLKINFQQLKGGLTGADVYTDGIWVHKTDKNSLEAGEWFQKADSIVKVPKIERIVGDTITMEFIDHDPYYFKNHPYRALGIIQENLEKFRRTKTNKKFTFQNYYDRIKGHVELSGVQNFEITLKNLNNLWIKQTFSHGDFGITNLLFKDHELYLIDPIYNGFGSYELDAAKFCASLAINNYSFYLLDLSLKTLSRFCEIDFEEFKILVLAEVIRVYKYHPDKNFILDVHNKILGHACF